MTVFCLAVLFSAPAFAAKIDFPPLTGRVVDQAHLLSADSTQQLTKELAAQESKTGQQVVVAIVSSLQGQTIEDYGYQLGRFWGIGQKDKDTGAILLVAPKEHQVRIEVGYGLEGTLTDAKAFDIINQVILPRFKAGKMQDGVVEGTSGILNVLNGQAIGVTTATNQDLQSMASGMDDSTPHGLGIGFGLIFFFLILALFMQGGSAWWLPLGFMSQSWGSGSGGLSIPSFSGGGGSFGGGGASGSW